MFAPLFGYEALKPVRKVAESIPNLIRVKKWSWDALCVSSFFSISLPTFVPGQLFFYRENPISGHSQKSVIKVESKKVMKRDLLLTNFSIKIRLSARFLSIFS